MFLLPDEIQNIIYEYDPTYRLVLDSVLTDIKNSWGVICPPCIGNPRPCSVIRWGLSREQAEIVAQELWRRFRDITGARFDSTFTDENDFPLILNSRYRIPSKDYVSCHK